MLSTIRHRAAALTVTLALGACGGGAEEAIKDFEALNKKACACTDKACADAAFEELRALADRHKNATSHREADVEKLTYWLEGAAKCLVAKGVTLEQLQALSDSL